MYKIYCARCYGFIRSSPKDSDFVILLEKI